MCVMSWHQLRNQRQFPISKTAVSYPLAMFFSWRDHQHGPAVFATGRISCHGLNMSKLDTVQESIQWHLEHLWTSSLGKIRQKFSVFFIATGHVRDSQWSKDLIWPLSKAFPDGFTKRSKQPYNDTSCFKHGWKMPTFLEILPAINLHLERLVQYLQVFRHGFPMGFCLQSPSLKGVPVFPLILLLDFCLTAPQRQMDPARKSRMVRWWFSPWFSGCPN